MLFNTASAAAPGGHSPSPDLPRPAPGPPTTRTFPSLVVGSLLYTDPKPAPLGFDRHLVTAHRPALQPAPSRAVRLCALLPSQVLCDMNIKMLLVTRRFYTHATPASCA